MPPMPRARTIARLSTAATLLLGAAAFIACQRKTDGEAITPTHDPSRVSSTSSSADGSHAEAPKHVEKHGTVPERHRPTAVACSTDKVVGDVETRPADAGTGYGATCKKDAECTAGKNGRCAMSGGGRLPPTARCIYDACFSDSDCGKASQCKCEGSPGSGNYCVAGNCATDDDCGDSYCSPTYGTSCGPYGGYQGNNCHTDKDECTNDSECGKKGEAGYCAWFPEVGHWKCGYGYCVG